MNFKIAGEPVDYTDLSVALKLFGRAAARFQEEHKRPAVLVLDNMDIVAQGSPKNTIYPPAECKDRRGQGAL